MFTGALIWTGEPAFSIGGHSCGVAVIVVPDLSLVGGADLGDFDGVIWYAAGVVAGALGTRVEKVGDTACKGDISLDTCKRECFM